MEVRLVRGRTSSGSGAPTTKLGRMTTVEIIVTAIVASFVTSVACIVTAGYFLKKKIEEMMNPANMLGGITEE